MAPGEKTQGVRMAGFANKVRVLKMALAVGAASCALQGGTATAQNATARQSIDIDIPAGTLGDALIALGRQAKVQIAFLPDRVAGRKVSRLRGNFTIDEALARLLRGTLLGVQRLQNGSYVVGGPTKATAEKIRRYAADAASDQGIVNGDPGIPEILVTGRRALTLNADIPHTENEAQPYTVFSREQIKRSGAMNLEDFLRDNLGASTSVRTSAQGGGVTSRDSIVNLRGIGLDGTLILVDGRRYAEPNSGVAGTFTQSSVVGIPLDQIERVEVLASSAAGQYGSNAVGGVINIVLRRDFHGIETSAYVGGTTKGNAIERRLSVNATFPIAAKTTLTLSGSWKKSDPLYAGDTDFINERLAYILKNNPKYLETAQLIYSTTPNIRSSNGSNLVLRPQYAVNGVTALNSAVTYLPAGYRGIALDGPGALLTNAGRQNLTPSPNDSGQGPILGDRIALIYGNTVWNGTATLRSDVTDWLSLYGSASYNRVEASSDTTPVPNVVNLPANNPLNPFTTAIDVSFPSNEPFVRFRSKSDSFQLIGGAIVTLPWHWRASFDVNTSTNTSDSYGSKRQLDPTYYAQLVTNPSINVLLDTLAYPLSYQYDTNGHYSRRSPSKSSLTSYKFTLAGPIGFARLWGGKPVMTLSAEVQRQWLGDSVSYTDGPGSASVSYSPERSLNTKSAYGQLVLPIVGEDNHVPLMSGLELRLSGRYDAYSGLGANTTFQCVSGHPGVLTPAEEDAPCPAPGVTIPYRRVNNHSINPVVAAKWSVTPDIAFRGTYSTGYTPPQLNNVVPNTGLSTLGFTNGLSVAGRDPLRGNERIGTSIFGIFWIVEGLNGGNPDIDPQKSNSWSFGTILTPRFVKGLTLRADWTKIVIENGYYDPSLLINGTTPQELAALADFMSTYPERFRRGPVPAGDPYTVGPIIYIDATTANLSRFTSEALDFSGEYLTQIGDGQLSINASATLMLHLTRQLTPTAPVIDFTGVVSAQNFYSNGDSLKFKGNLSANYSTSRWNVGARARHFSGYYVNNAHTRVLEQGSNRVNAQTYFDIFGGVKVFKKTDLSIGVNNLLNKRPAYDVTRVSGYAPNGDPRMRTFYVNLTQRF